MTLERNKRFHKILDEMKRIHDSKSHDYSNDSDKFSNFKLCETLGICSTVEGFLVRMSDKLSRVSQLIHKDRQVVDESITDTLLDLAVYSIMLKEYMEDTKK